MLLYGRHQHSIVKTNKQMHKKPQWDTTVTSFEWLSTKILMIPSKTVFGEKLGLLCIYRGNAELYGHSGNQYAKFLPCCYCSVAKSCLALLTSWTAAHQASLSFTISQSLLKLMSIELVMSSNHLILLIEYLSNVRHLLSQALSHIMFIIILWDSYLCGELELQNVKRFP